MKYEHYKNYLSQAYALEVIESEEEEIITGNLKPKDVKKQSIPIVKRIPRFVQDKNYADNFGLQWNTFRSTQLDSASGLSLTANRFWSNTHWQPEALLGKTVLEVGSGAGRFTEILLQAGANVVSFDYSNAVEANQQNNQNKGDLFIFQGDLYDIPFNDRFFDFVFCHGVLQHTPDPSKAYQSIFAKLKLGGKISIDYYAKHLTPNVWSTPKYFWRPITAHMLPNRLYKIVKTYIPLYLPIDTVIRKIPKFGTKLLALIPIPCWNYVDWNLTSKQRLEWAIMDTFDALGARYDSPKTLEEVAEMVASEENATAEVFYGSNGIVANITRKL